MIDFDLRPSAQDPQRWLERFRDRDVELGPQQYRTLADLLHTGHGLAETVLVELCRFDDADLIRFFEGAWHSGVAEAMDLVEGVLQRRGLVGLTPWIERRLDSDSDARWLVEVLSDVRDDISTRLLLELLDHGSAGVRSRAADGLRAHRDSVDPRAFVRYLAQPLVRGLTHPDPLRAIRALQRLAEPALEPDFGRDAARRAERVLLNCVTHERRRVVRGDAIAALGDLGSRAAVRCLVDALHREDESLHQEVVIALRKIRPERALIALLGLLRSPDPIVREEAAAALGEVGDRQAVRRLRALLDDEDPDVRQEAVLALGKLGGREVLDLLDRALSDPDPSVRISACSALALSGGNEAQGKLIRALYDHSPGVRSEAAQLLGDLGDEAATDHLRLVAEDIARDAFGDRVGAVARRAIWRLEWAARYGRDGSS